MRPAYSLEHIAEQIVRAFAPLHPERVLLFGSVARGRWDEESDVDVVVVYPTDKRFLDRLKELHLRWPLPMAADILAYTPEEFRDMLEWNAFLQDVVSKGKTIYERPEA